MDSGRIHIFIQYMNVSYCLIKPSHFPPVGIHKDLKLLHCSSFSIPVNIS